MDGFAIDGILLDDKSRPKKQQHTAKRIFERLRDEYGFTGGITIVKDYVAGWHRRAQEMFVPLEHRPGHAQVDFGEAIGIIGGSKLRLRSTPPDAQGNPPPPHGRQASSRDVCERLNRPEKPPI